MCETCGCSDDLNHGHKHVHEHDHSHEVKLGVDILDHNRRFAEANRKRFAERRITAVNVLGSPGAGKTTLLAATLERLKGKLRCAVITGDLVGDEDRRRLAATGVPVLQIETGRVCHLDAHMVGHALEELPLGDIDLLFIENVGNLVCPAAFDLGETRRVVVLSVTEGADKPSKYPEMFSSADAVLLAKSDLEPHVSFDRPRAEGDLRTLRFTMDILSLSAKTSEGMDRWIDWLERSTRR